MALFNNPVKKLKFSSSVTKFDYHNYLLVISTKRGKLLKINSTGREILHLLEKGISPKDITNKLSKKFSQAPEHILPYVNTFINLLLKEGILCYG